MSENVAFDKLPERNETQPDPYPDGPMRQRDPEPDRIPRQDTNPLPHTAPAEPSFPRPAPAGSGS